MSFMNQDDFDDIETYYCNTCKLDTARIRKGKNGTIICKSCNNPIKQEQQTL